MAMAARCDACFYPQRLCTCAMKACGQRGSVLLSTDTWHGVLTFCAVLAGPTRSNPQRLWNVSGKACGQLSYLPDRKGACDGVRKCCSVAAPVHASLVTADSNHSDETPSPLPMRIAASTSLG
jgi:hypothetical protein